MFGTSEGSTTIHKITKWHEVGSCRVRIHDSMVSFNASSVRLRGDAFKVQLNYFRVRLTEGEASMWKVSICRMLGLLNRKLKSPIATAKCPFRALIKRAVAPSLFLAFTSAPCFKSSSTTAKCQVSQGTRRGEAVSRFKKAWRSCQLTCQCAWNVNQVSKHMLLTYQQHEQCRFMRPCLS